MTPYQLAKDSESSQQMALFCYCAKAQVYGFKQAKHESLYVLGSKPIMVKFMPIPELAFFHHIPNGGSRGDSARSAAIAGGKLKAEGVKAGVLDCFWPLSRGGYHGLYIEMKAKKGKVSEEQRTFSEYVLLEGYAVRVCYDWLEAADCLESYYGLEK